MFLGARLNPMFVASSTYEPADIEGLHRHWLKQRLQTLDVSPNRKAVMWQRRACTLSNYNLGPTPVTARLSFTQIENHTEEQRSKAYSQVSRQLQDVPVPRPRPTKTQTHDPLLA